MQSKRGLLNALQRSSSAWDCLQGYFASRTLIEPLGPGRCRHVLEQEIR
jgi:hypothetical protein